MTGGKGVHTFVFWHRALPPNFWDVLVCLTRGHIDWKGGVQKWVYIAAGLMDGADGRGLNAPKFGMEEGGQDGRLVLNALKFGIEHGSERQPFLFLLIRKRRWWRQKASRHI